ncbi:group III truncated hemoglobin [Aquimarina sp. MMG016]|uniref:group III truncated hemoglobin n=1 Tax=Aquimarina sp. MMG016 TaxID=2822690 RepID=UPI001B3A751A|nr:group III truncated hemoglobin [Aquimarina sp. MMG016]MBQ4821138.1 group III truncated hemoglobin [Aquimarina sp. MMG016]
MKNKNLVDIQNREDIHTLVSLFYKKVRSEKQLAPIFNKMITNWDEHINRLTDFWETNLFFVAKFKGNPIKKHQEADVAVNNSITNEHFGIWLRLWINTLDELYKGELASIAKNRARNIGTMLFMKIFENRKS